MMDAIDPQLVNLTTQLASLAVQNSASAIMGRVKAARTGKVEKEQINELVELINELVDDRNQLVAVARALEQEIAGRTISADDLEFITATLIPTVEAIMPDDDSAIERISSTRRCCSGLNGTTSNWALLRSADSLHGSEGSSSIHRLACRFHQVRA